MNKSTRHSKIIGDFGESFVCEFLSREGFEIAKVDHTGLDLIAYNPADKKHLGISVKSRTRNEGKEKLAVNVFSCQKGKDDREKLNAACDAFGCKPWIAVYVENLSGADLYLVDLDIFDKYKGGKVVETWKMDNASKERYAVDPCVKHIRIEMNVNKWRF